MIKSWLSFKSLIQVCFASTQWNKILCVCKSLITKIYLLIQIFADTDHFCLLISDKVPTRNCLILCPYGKLLINQIPCGNLPNYVTWFWIIKLIKGHICIDYEGVYFSNYIFTTELFHVTIANRSMSQIIAKHAWVALSNCGKYLVLYCKGAAVA